MACQKCDHKGYVETFIAIHNGFRPQVRQCTHCMDTRAYSERVRQMLNGPENSVPKPPPRLRPVK